jgi:3-hydroxyacyl-CoA dehydrogenase/enoyl-CoA hydratase/3-hydroxybutyryl-CoA epimerase
MIQREIGDDHVCVLTFDRPESGANIFDAATLNELGEHVDLIESDEKKLRGLIITSAKKSIFIAGADLKTLLKQAQTGELRDFIARGQRIFNRIAALKIPTVAAIHGACAGGGYEITLACDYRVASDDPATRIGLPETTLGLVPAWGGCTRLPRLIGRERAAEVILKGKLYSAPEALKLGLIDEIAPRNQLVDLARKKLRDGKRKALPDSFSTSESPSPYPVPEGEADGKAAGEGKSIEPRANGNAAPARALEVIKKGLATSVDESLVLELNAIVDIG